MPFRLAMKAHRTIELFAARPRSAAFLAALMLCLAAITLSGWIPTSVNRRYFPGHEWFLASLCVTLSVFFAYCARIGFSKQNPERKD